MMSFGATLSKISDLLCHSVLLVRVIKSTPQGRVYFEKNTSVQVDNLHPYLGGMQGV